MSTQVKHPTPFEEAEERFDQAMDWAEGSNEATAIVKAIRAAALLLATVIHTGNMQRD